MVGRLGVRDEADIVMPGAKHSTHLQKELSGVSMKVAQWMCFEECFRGRGVTTVENEAVWETRA